MGTYLSQLVSGLFGYKESRALFCGLDAAGKTSILYRLISDEMVTTIPTIGFNVETVQVGKLTITAWDVGGRDNTRTLKRHYYANTNMIIFVVDSNDRDRMGEAKEELQQMLAEDELRDAVLLVLANKQDIPKCMTLSEIATVLDLNSIRNRKYILQPCSAVTGEGIFQGFEAVTPLL